MMLPCFPKRLVLAKHLVDFRKQWNGLLTECYSMGFNPYLGDCVVFVKKDKTQLRALLGDELGLMMLARRFEGGCMKFSWLFEKTPVIEAISIAELMLLLEGSTFQISHRVKSWKKILPTNSSLT